MEHIVKIQDLGFEIYTVKEIHVERGQFVKAGDVLITIESSKVAVEVRSESDGLAFDVLVHVGDRVKSGNAVLRLEEDFLSYENRQKSNVVPLLRQGDVYGSLAG